MRGSARTWQQRWGRCRSLPTASQCAKLVMLKSQEEREGIREESSIIGVDLAKNVFQVHGAAGDGTVLFRKKLTGCSSSASWRSNRPACWRWRRVVARITGRARCGGSASRAGIAPSFGLSQGLHSPAGCLRRPAGQGIRRADRRHRGRHSALRRGAPLLSEGPGQLKIFLDGLRRAGID